VIVAQLDGYEPPRYLWRQWQRHEPALGGHEFRALRPVLLDRDVPADRKDAVLAALIRCGQRGPDDAARLAVIVCLLPGVRRIAGRFADILGWHDALAELLVSLWQQLECLDVDRRADRIASRLLAAGAHRLAYLARRERVWRDQTSIGQDPDYPAAPVAAVETIGMSHAVSAGVLDSFDAALIEATRLNGLSLMDAAALLGVSYEAAKKRRRRAETTWLCWWAPDLRPTYAGTRSAAA
jgi:DNA-directed RNA polymerase specialized sigma24 family protein